MRLSASMVSACFLISEGSSRILSRLLIVSSLMSRDGIACYFSLLRAGSRFELEGLGAVSASCFFELIPSTIRSS
jgi:hypothetical protein